MPDLADLWFDVEVRHADLTQARMLQADRAEKVVKALRAAGIAEADLQTSQVTISPSYIENRQETANIQFYSVSQTVTCTVQDLKKVPGHHGSRFSRQEPPRSRPAQLRSSEYRKHRDEARLRAVRVAKEKRPHSPRNWEPSREAPSNSEEAESWWSAGNNIQSVGRSGTPETSSPQPSPPERSASTASVSVSFVLE